MNNKKILVLLFLLIVLIATPIVYGFNLNTYETSKNVCPGNTILLTANVNGDGFFDVNLDGSASAWSTVVPNSFSLQGLQGNSRTLYIYVTPNSNVIPGDYNLNLIVSTEQETKTESYDINVDSCHNIQITGDISKEMCSCNLDVYTYTIKNTGSYDESLNINLDGSAKEFITLSQDGMLLHPGESKILYAYANVPCEKEGDYGFTLKAENDNVISGFDSSLRVNSCFDFDLSTDKDYINFCEHSIENIEVTVKNLGQNSNNFYASVDGPDWANIDTNKLNINSLKERSFNLVFNPDYKVKGTFDINLDVKSEFGNVKKSKNIVADVRQCHGVILDILENKAKICAGLENNYDIKIKNIGESKKEFKIETSEEWARLNRNSLVLDKDDEETINLEINPDIDLIGDYDVYVKTSALDDSLVESEDKIEVNVVSNEDCYMPEIKADDLDVNRDSSATLPIVIENRGNEIASYNIIVSGDGSSFSHINPANIKNLEPGKSEVVYLYVAPSIEINKGIYRLNIGVVKDETILKNKYINLNVKEAIEYTKEEKKDGFFDKIVRWFNNLFKVPETVVDFKEEKTVNKDTKFRYKDTEHNLKVLNVSKDSVTIVIESSPVIVLLDLGESKNIDITGDGVNDLTVTLEKIENNMPYITVKEIIEGIDEGNMTDDEELDEEFTSEEFEEELVNISEVEETEELGNIIEEGLFNDEEEFNESQPGEEVKEQVKEQKSLFSRLWDYKNYILYSIIIIIVLIILFNIFSKSDDEEIEDDESEDEGKDDEDEEKEELEEGGEPLKIGRWIFGIIVFGILIYLIYRYNGIFFAYLSVYKYYVLIGIIALIILLLLIRHWDNIADFFEEEVEEEEKTGKKVKRPVKKKKKR